VNTWKEQLDAKVKAAAATEKSAGSASSWISLKGSQISIDGAAVPGDSLDMVVLDYVLENQYYDVDFDPDVPASPVCFAFGTDAKTMGPHEESPDAQHATCLGCPNAQWGSAKRGKGKACKEIRRLACISAGEVDEVETAELRMLKIPVTSTEFWSGYVRHLSEVMGLPPCAVVTRMTIIKTPEERSPFKLSFKYVSTIDEKLLPGIFARVEHIQDDLLRPYDPVEAPPPKPEPARRPRKFAQ
jgi:hypothetical protein